VSARSGGALNSNCDLRYISAMPREFSITHRVQFSETDMAGIVHFSNYFRLMEEVEHAFLRSLGLSVVMQEGGVEIAFPRKAVSCEYHEPMRFEDVVELKLRVTRLGEKSMHFEVDFVLGGKHIALGKITSVCCVVENGRMKSTSIPPRIKALLSE
jgi:acyl-CoA thioester hydrolase